MKALQNKQVRQTESGRKVQNGEVSARQMWEEHQRQSVESVSGANGWMHAGIQNSHFFYPSILH